MPKSPKYPLKPLLEHRDRQVDDATAGLAGAIREREAAADRKGRLERERREAESRAANERNAERDRLAGGELRVADLAHADAWEAGVHRQITDLSNAVDRASADTDEASRKESEARADLARKKADRDVVAKDETRYADKLRRRADASEEEDAAEAWRGKRGSE